MVAMTKQIQLTHHLVMFSDALAKASLMLATLVMSGTYTTLRDMTNRPNVIE